MRTLLPLPDSGRCPRRPTRALLVPLLVLTLLFGPGATAQNPAPRYPIPNLPYWQWQYPRPTGYPLYDVVTLGDSSALAVGYHATAVRTRDAGRSWQVLPMPPGVRRTLTSVSFANSLNGWIGAESDVTGLATQYRTGPGRVLHTTDGGNTWTVQSTGETQSALLPKVVAVSPNTAYVFYTWSRRSSSPNGGRSPFQPRGRRTTNGGATWTALPPLPLPTSLDNGAAEVVIKDVEFPTPTLGFLCLQDLRREVGCVLRTADGGQTWQQVVRDSALGFVPYDLCFTDAQHGWMVGNEGGRVIGNGSIPSLFRTADGGLTWTLIPNLTGAPGPFLGAATVSFPDPAHGLAGDWVTQDSGRTWTRFNNNALLPLVSTLKTTLRPSGIGWAVGGNGMLARTTDYGQNWQGTSRLLTPGYPKVIYRFQSPDADHAYAWASYYGQLKLTLLSTADRGAHWRRRELTATDFTPLGGVNDNDFAAPDADTLWLSGRTFLSSAPFGFVARSTDAGATWTPQILPSLALPTTFATGFFIGARDTRRLVVAGGNQIAYTHDGGQTWTRAVSPSTHTLLDVTWADSATVYITTDTLALLRSADAGRTWQEIVAQPGQLYFPLIQQLPGYPEPLTFTSALVGYATGLRTTDGGQTWSRVMSRQTEVSQASIDEGGNVGAVSYQSFSFRTAREGWIGAGNDVFRTFDAGQSWTNAGYIGQYFSDGGSDFARTVVTPIDRYNAYLTGVGIAHYSEKYIQTDTTDTQRLTYCTGDVLSLAFDTTGFFSPAEDSFRIEISNKMGRFRPHETTLLPLVGRANASPLRATLPATLAPGTRYRLRVIRADSSLLGGDNQRDVTIFSRPAAVDVAPADSARICQGDSVLLSAPAGFAAYRWTSGDTTATLWVTQATTYAVQVASGGRCFGPLSPPVTVRVTPTPPAPAFSAQPQTSGIVVLTSTSPTGNQWYFNGQPIPGATAATYAVTTATQSGAYALQLTQRGCASPLSPPQTITVTGTAVEAVAALGLTLVPNPAQQRLRLTSGEALHEVTLTDLSGRVVLRRTLEKVTSVELALPRLPTGTYLLTAITPTGRSATRRLLIAP